MSNRTGRRMARGIIVGCIVAACSGAPSPAAAAPSAATVDKAARVNGKSEAQVRKILADVTARVNASGRIHFVEPARRLDSTAPAPQLAPLPYAQTFTLHSRPGSSRVIYLDFTGETISGTAWNGSYGTSTSAFYAEPFSLDATPDAFSDAEQDVIQSVWQRVAEDYAPFDVDVTTQDPGAAAIDRVGSADTVFGTRALITDASEIKSSCSCGGVAYLGVFDVDELARDLPAGVRVPREPRRQREEHRGGGDPRGRPQLRPEPRRHVERRLLHGSRRVGADHGRRLLAAGRAVEQGRVHGRQHHAGRSRDHPRQRRRAAGRRRRQHDRDGGRPRQRTRGDVRGDHHDRRRRRHAQDRRGRRSGDLHARPGTEQPEPRRPAQAPRQRGHRHRDEQPGVRDVERRPGDRPERVALDDPPERGGVLPRGRRRRRTVAREHAATRATGPSAATRWPRTSP